MRSVCPPQTDTSSRWPPLGQYVALLESDEDGFHLELLERVSCDEFESRVVELIDLAIQGVVPLPDSPEELAASSGESLIGIDLQGVLLFSHFDGKNLRQFRVDVNSGWHFDETIQMF